jgi:hypothetical protein
MSRRHHGRPHHHAQGAVDRPRRAAGVSPAANAAPQSTNGAGPAPTPRPQGPAGTGGAGPTGPARPVGPPAAQPGPLPAVAHHPTTPGPAFVPHAEARPVAPGGAAPAPGLVAPSGPAVMGPDRNGQCTSPQLRRFIKSRPYVPMHELRRRFGIDGGDDDVTPVRLEPGWVYVGLPSREGMLLGELLRAGEIGYELSLDPRSPIVIGVYPMRPIPRG